VLTDRKREARRLVPALGVHGVGRVLQLLRDFFGSEEGWWVEKKSYGIGPFVGAINDLVLAAAVEQREENDPDWHYRWAQMIRQ